MSAQPSKSAKPKMTKAERKLAESAYFAALLNTRMAKDDKRREAANEVPLMKLVIPDDFFSRPRMYGYRLDVEHWENYARKTRDELGEDREETAQLEGIELVSTTLALLKAISGIQYLSLEWCLPEDYSRAEARKNRTLRQLSTPTSTPAGGGDPIPFLEPEPEPMFMILMVFMVTRYKKILKRPSQMQIDCLTTELHCEPEWYVDAEED